MRTAGLAMIVAVALLAGSDRPLSASPQNFDFATGGGWFTPRSESEPTKTEKVTFGFEAGYRRGTTVPHGLFNLVDRNTDGVQVKGTNVDRYEPFDAEPCRIFWGNAEMSTMPGVLLRYSVGVCDYPRRNDRIRVTVCIPFTLCETWGAGSNGGEAPGTVYFADNENREQGCPEGHKYCGELERGNIQLRGRQIDE